MIVIISGSINSGKTTTAKALANVLDAEFIDVDDMNDLVPHFDLSKDIHKGIAVAIEKIDSLTNAGKSVIVSDVIRPEDKIQFEEGLQEKNIYFVTLAPRLEIAQSNRGNRELSEWEIARVKYHYDTGIASPSFGIVIDNSELTIDEVVDKIIAQL